MINLRALQENTAYREGAIRKGADPQIINRLLSLNEDRQTLRLELENLQAQSNTLSRDIGQADHEERDTKIKEASALKQRLKAAEAAYAQSATATDELALTIPNPAAEAVPSGGEQDFETVEVVGEKVEPPPMDHATYGEFMGWVETEKAAQNMGSRFAYLKGDAVLLEFALIQWVLGKLIDKGFTPIVTPVLVREEMMLEAGFFPTDRNQVYGIEDDDLFLIGTSEVALAGLHRGELLNPHDLPLRYAGFSSCFRREAGTYGKDTSGIFRVHQFDKLEMFCFADGESSWDELDFLLSIEKEIISELGLPYRVIRVAAGDLGAAAAMKYDCEVWLPSEGAYRELTSTSNYLDYSARRLQTRKRTDSDNPLVHTLNGTACAIGRTLVFIMEHYQQLDGSLFVPEVLRPFCGLATISPPN